MTDRLSFESNRNDEVKMNDESTQVILMAIKSLDQRMQSMENKLQAMDEKFTYFMDRQHSIE